MKLNICISGLSLITGGILTTLAAEKPNIIVILADDMGYSDLGCYGGEVETPNLNNLAASGLRYRQFYNSARSCPSRAALMTGLYPQQAGMGWMAAADMGRPAYHGYLNKECVTIAEVLKSTGYKTYMTGKWHLSSDRQNKGKVIEYWPNQRGFDHFFGIVDGASNYYDMTYNVDNNQFESPKDGSFYFTHAISDTATAYIGRHKYQEQPLFLYVAYTAPHWPLHALQQDIDKYADVYQTGWDKLRTERFQRQQGMGLFHENTNLSLRDEKIDSWDKLNSQQKQEFAMRMAVYAAQIDAMDQGIGRIIAELKKKGQFDNTVIMFMSDNGACAEFISRGNRQTPDGKADTYESYRINWANLSSTPYREYKHFTHEGGIASPLIVHYPDGIKKDINNSFVGEYGHFTDIMATCVDLAGASYPTTFRGHSIHPMQGVSLVPNFNGNKTGRDFTFWEHESNIAMRDGKWKIVCKTKENTAFNEKSVMLYDMEADPTELNDLSGAYPEKRADMYARWMEWAENTDVLPMDSRDYGQRARTYKRDIINGEFNDNFGDWDIFTNTQNSDIRYSIDTVNAISGGKTARIDVIKSGPQPNASFLKWKFPTGKKNAVASVSFKAKSDKISTVFVRIEKIGNVANKPLDEKIFPRCDKAMRYTFEDIQLPENSDYQLVFYMGEARGVNWIDDIKLVVK